MPQEDVAMGLPDADRLGCLRTSKSCLDRSAAGRMDLGGGLFDPWRWTAAPVR